LGDIQESLRTTYDRALRLDPGLQSGASAFNAMTGDF
jgi:hypothetical protein